MKEFFKAFLSFGLATSIEKLLGFVLLPVYTRYFNKVEFGIIDLVGTILMVTSIFGLLQLETSLQRYYYEFKGNKRKLLISNIYILISVFSVFIGVILYLVSSIISEKLFNSDEYSYLIKIISFELPLVNLTMLGLVLLRFERENIKFLKVIIIKVGLSLFAVYIFVILFKMGLKGVFYAQLFSIFITAVIVTLFVRHLVAIKFSRIMSHLNLKYALPQFPARIGSVALGQANRFFILGYLSLAAVGIYSVSLKIASSIQLVNTAFIMAWAPFMHAQFKNHNNKKVFAKVFPLIACGTFLFVCLISLFSTEAVQLLATEEFYSSSKYVGGLALFFSLYIIKETIDIGPKIKEKTKYLSYTFLLSLIVNLASLYLLIIHYQLEGVVFAMIITNLFLVSFTWFISNRLYYIPFSIKYFIIFLFPALVFSILPLFYNLTLLIRLLFALFSILFYGSFLLKKYKDFKSINI